MSSDDWTGATGAEAGSQSGSRPEIGSGEDEASGNHRIRLVKGGAILLERDGFRIIESRGLKRSPLLAYESITHITVTSRSLLIATLTGLSILRASDFPDPETGPNEARRALLARLAERPDGDYVLERNDRLEALSKQKSRSYAVWAVVAICLVVAVLQIRDSMVSEYGSFVTALFQRGELWRAVTAHFLHGAPRFPIHLAMNVGGLLVIGSLVERPLGTIKTTLVLALGAVGTIMGSVYYEYEEVVGASGLVSALAGGMLALELHHPETLAAGWRLPRRLFIWALILQFVVVDQLLANYLAGGAHLGGFAGGYAAVWLMRGPTREGAEESGLLQALALGAAAILVFGMTTLAPLARHDEAALERHALRLLNSPQTLGIQHDNAIAWFIATEGEPSSSGLQLAVALADRAVTATDRLNPNVLDTLAEAFFAAGDRLAALLTIEEAIRLAPMEPYFHEQRKRFTGERDANDRPEPPSGAGSGGSADDEDERFPVDPEAPAITL